MHCAAFILHDFKAIKAIIINQNPKVSKEIVTKNNTKDIKLLQNCYKQGKICGKHKKQFTILQIVNRKLDKRFLTIKQYVNDNTNLM